MPAHSPLHGNGDLQDLSRRRRPRVMVRSFVRTLVALTLCTLVLAGCERKQRARERDAVEAQAKAKRDAKRLAALAAAPPAPMPEEPPVELLRVPDSGLPCAVDDVFARKCRRCHTIPARHGAPFVFLTWQDTQQLRGDQPLTTIMGRAVRSNFMPYRIEANPKVEPLTDEEKKVILDWVDAGGPREQCDPSAATGKKPIATAKPKASSSAAPKPAGSAPAPAH